MKEVKQFSSKAELIEEAQETYKGFIPADVITASRIKIEPYGFDERIGWDTHIVTVEGIGPLGFIDRMVN